MHSAGDDTALAIIPARFASTRFPGKVIAPLEGKPLVLHAYEHACAASRVAKALIATDDERVVQAMRPYGAEVVMSRTDHASGTDRVAEVARRFDAPIIVNVQADEPLLTPTAVDAAIRPLLEDPALPMATLCRRIVDPAIAGDPNVVKVVCNLRRRALYFSRQPIPNRRDTAEDRGPQFWLQHIGLYAFRRDSLLEFTTLPQTPLERLEKLEQLRALEHGFHIEVVEVDCPCIGVDTPEDLERVRAFLERTTAPGALPRAPAH